MLTPVRALGFSTLVALVVWVASAWAIVAAEPPGADAKLLEAVVRAFGPAGAAFAVMAAGIFLAYRRDVLKQRDRAEEDRATLLRLLERHADVIERHAQASERLAGALEQHHATETAALARIEEVLGEVDHTTRNDLERTNILLDRTREKA